MLIKMRNFLDGSHSDEDNGLISLKSLDYFFLNNNWGEKYQSLLLVIFSARQVQENPK